MSLTTLPKRVRPRTTFRTAVSGEEGTAEAAVVSGEEGTAAEGGDGFLRADQIDLKSLDEQLERHLSRAWTMEKKEEERSSGCPERQREEWEIDPSKLFIKGAIARGTFGAVHRGVYDGQDVMFTNSDRKHVKRVLERLGIEEECFHRIVCFETLNPHLFNNNKEESSTQPQPPATPEVILKPSITAVETAVRLAGFDPRRTVRSRSSRPGPTQRWAPTGRISSLQALLGLLWRSVTRARHLKPVEETAYGLLIGCRSRLGPSLPATYLGNAILFVRAKSTAGELVERGPGWAA